MNTPLAFNLQPRRPGWGVRVEPRKAQSLAGGLRQAALPRRVILPLEQLPERSAIPLVKPGDRVLSGQPVARLENSDNQLCASVSGEVLAIDTRAIPSASNQPARCIVIESDGRDSWHPDCVPPPPAGQLNAEQICAHIAAAGIVGLGGAVFPTARKLSGSHAAGLLILNGAECEPYISCDEILMRERPAHVVRGAAVMMRAMNTARSVIAVESDMPEARVALKDAIEAAGLDNIEVAVVTAKYPAGGERQLIELLTGLEVPVEGLPADIGIVCQNVATAAAVHDYWETGRPLVSRIVTVTGEGVSEPANVEARIGTPFADLVTAAGGYRQGDCELLMGGPMMGIALSSDRLPLTEASNCLIVAAPGEMSRPRPEFPCIRCAECSRVCPARLLPQDLLRAAEQSDQEGLQQLRLDACIECGCCDYVCPSQIPLTARFIAAKAEQHEWLTERERAVHFRERSDAHARRQTARADNFADGPAEENPLAALRARLRQKDSTDD